MSADRRIVVEALIPAPVPVVWERSQEPAQHVAWDIRFTQIEYLPEVDSRGFHLLDYRTSVALGIEVRGIGRYLHSTPLANSTFEFHSQDWKSLIRDGKGIWLYQAREGGTFFKTVYDYQSRYGWVGRFLDRLIFRRLLQLATEWGFETLRLWCGGDEQACAKRRIRWRFLGWMVGRLAGRSPAPGAARSWLGHGNERLEGDGEAPSAQTSRAE